ncbi:MAG: hypothetical protein LBL62_02625 [Planctomycetaceae bacterium]|nr:hypothetical protein [Planctomycetaceae bacterium]
MGRITDSCYAPSVKSPNSTGFGISPGIFVKSEQSLGGQPFVGGRPFAERLRRLSPTVNQINDDKLCCLPFWSQVKLNRRDRA